LSGSQLLKIFSKPRVVALDEYRGSRKGGACHSAEDFEREMDACVGRVASLVPPGAVEWAEENRPGLLRAALEAASRADEADRVKDWEAFAGALRDYERAWAEVALAYLLETHPELGPLFEKRCDNGVPRREGGTGGAVAEAAPAVPNGTACPNGPTERESDGTGFFGKETCHSTADPAAPSEKGVSTGGDIADTVWEDWEENGGDSYPPGPDTEYGEGLSEEADTPLHPALRAAVFGEKEDTDGRARQLALFPGGEPSHNTPSGDSAAALPFTPEPAPTAWREWLEKNVRIVWPATPDDLREAVAAAKNAGVCGIDTETTGLDPHTADLRLLQVAVPVYPEGGRRALVAEDWKSPEPGSGAVVYVLDMKKLKKSDFAAWAGAVRLLADLLGDASVSKAASNWLFDLKFVRAALSEAEGVPKWPGKRFRVEKLFDTVLASQLVTAGDFVPEAQFPKWCETNCVRVHKEGNKPTRYFDRHGHEIHFERDTQKEIRPVYPTHSLYEVAHRHLEVALDKSEQAGDWNREELTPEQVRYAAMDAAVLLPLREILIELIYRNRLAHVAKIEFDCLPASAEIEYVGMPFDSGRALEMLKEAEARVAELRSSLVALAREVGFEARPKKSGGKRSAPDLNPDSPVDVIDCLREMAAAEGVLASKEKEEGTEHRFALPGGETLKLESRDETLTRVANTLLDDSRLKRFIALLKEYRSSKKKADFLGMWLESKNGATGRLHPHLRQLNPQGVGRFSASNPSLQQAPRGSEIRRLFRPPQGRKLAICDYSAIEMRIMAELSLDCNLLDAFQKNIDIHRYTAGMMAGKPPDEVTKEERQAAKSFNFGLIYGMQGSTLKGYAETTYGVKMTLEEAESARQKFFEIYPDIAAWQEKQSRRAFEGGFEPFWRHDALRGFWAERRPCVRTLKGRLRVWPTVERERRDSEGTYLRKAGSFTELYNTPDQGSGADMLKLAMGRLYRELLGRGWDDVVLVVCVHDELVLEAPEELAGEAAEALRSVMVAAGEEVMHHVPVEAEAAVGGSWADKE